MGVTGCTAWNPNEQMWNERLDRIDDYLEELQEREGSSDT